MRLATYNVNGVRAAINKGLIDWIKSENLDIVCFQEVKAMEEQVDISLFKKLGFQHIYWHPAVKKGYSGVAVLSRKPASLSKIGCPNADYHAEGRIITLDYDDFSLINVYIPSGTNSNRQGFKMEFLYYFLNFCNKKSDEVKNLLVCGDFNICHKSIDIHNPIANKNNSGFLPEERAWVDDFVASGFTDAFRVFNADPHHYTWWTYRANARNNNKGWRIDYWMSRNNFVDFLKNCTIHPNAFQSDHCPVILEI